MRIEDLVVALRPENTALLLGAGASISSGAPSGAALAKTIAAKLTPPFDSTDLAEVCGVFAHRVGRRELVELIQERLRELRPTGGLLALPTLPWRAIYSTNFDQLVERSYQLADRSIHVVRSDYDFSTTPDPSATTLYKLHGCITQDISLGHHARMVLTELDYDEVDTYRRTLFTSLQAHMLTANTLIVGQSLSDLHLRNLAKEVGDLRQRGVPGRVFLLAYDYSEDRAALFEQRGIEVVQGSLDELIHLLLAAGTSGLGLQAPPPAPTLIDGFLPPTLAASTIDVSHAVSLPPDPVRLFNGAPATYADIETGLTISRAIERRLDETQQGSKGAFLVLQGAAGVGKTSLARRLLHLSYKRGTPVWEHVNAFPLNADAWLEVEANLRREGKFGALLVDDCAQQLNALNKLADGLGRLETRHLRLLVTVNAAQWRTRAKSKYFFNIGSAERLSLLTDSDLNQMVSLVDRHPDIRTLVEADFLSLGRRDQVRRLRERCSADMFVCLKNIFHNESLDNILLQEFADLEKDAQDIYRHVAAIQAMGGKVHRQLIMRLLNLEAGAVQTLLGQMDAVVSEYDVKPHLGIYGWSTRHDVIANVITTYKYAGQAELYKLLDGLIESLNPTEYLEMDTARSIASHEMGIGRLSDINQQAELLGKLISRVPAERTPRRRLIRLYLTTGQLPEAERAVAVTRREIGPDNIVDRYRALLALQRSEQLSGLLDEDRLAMLLEAERLARGCVVKQPGDRYHYRALSDVAIALATRFGETRLMDETIVIMRQAEVDIPDPDFVRDRRDLEARRRLLMSQG